MLWEWPREKKLQEFFDRHLEDMVERTQDLELDRPQCECQFLFISRWMELVKLRSHCCFGFLLWIITKAHSAILVGNL